MVTCRVLELFQTQGEVDVYVERLPQKTLTPEQMLPVISNFGSPDSPRKWVIVTVTQGTELIGKVEVLSWVPVVWEHGEPQLCPNDAGIHSVMIEKVPAHI